jgi:hypothetical protein
VTAQAVVSVEVSHHPAAAVREQEHRGRSGAPVPVEPHNHAVSIDINHRLDRGPGPHLGVGRVDHAAPHLGQPRRRQRDPRLGIERRAGLRVKPSRIHVVPTGVMLAVHVTPLP